MATINATDHTFDQETKEGVVLVDFWAPWCGPCKRIAPILEELSYELGDTAKVVKVDVDENPDTAGKFSIMSIPTMVLFRNGKAVDKFVGVQSKTELLAAIQEQLNHKEEGTA